MQQPFILGGGFADPYESLETKLGSLSILDVGINLLGDRVKKRPISENYQGLCTFHVEESPSFYLRQQRNNFYCYGCQKLGGPLTLLFELLHPNSIKFRSELIGDYFKNLKHLEGLNPFNYLFSKFGLDANKEEHMKFFMESVRIEQERFSEHFNRAIGQNLIESVNYWIVR